MWPLPCKPEALAAASTGFVRGGAGVLLDSCINKYVNRFPSCGVRITGHMVNRPVPASRLATPALKLDNDLVPWTSAAG